MRSRSVNPEAGEPLLAGRDFAGELRVSLSSASERFGTMLAHNNAARRIWNSLPWRLNARISLSSENAWQRIVDGSKCAFGRRRMLLRCLGMLAFSALEIRKSGVRMGLVRKDEPFQGLAGTRREYRISNSRKRGDCFH